MSWVTSTSVLPARALGAEDVHALLRERGVADGQHLVDEHDVGVGLDHDGEREPDHHARRVVLELEVGELAQLGEVEHRVEPAPRLAPAQAHHHAVEHDVLARGQLGVEADAELDERRQPPGHADAPGVGAVDARHDLQQRALARAVAPDDPEELALVDVEETSRSARSSRWPPRRERMQRPLLERVDAVLRDAEGLLEPAGLDDDGRCGSSASSPKGTRPLRRRPASAQPPLLEAGRSGSGVGGRRPGRGAGREAAAPDEPAAAARSRCPASRPAGQHAQRARGEPRERGGRALGGDEALAARAAWPA